MGSDWLDDIYNVECTIRRGQVQETSCRGALQERFALSFRAVFSYSCTGTRVHGYTGPLNACLVWLFFWQPPNHIKRLTRTRSKYAALPPKKPVRPQFVAALLMTGNIKISSHIMLVS